MKDEAIGKKIVKTDEEWRREMPDEQFSVTRQKGTEPAFAGRYWDNHDKGIYKCSCCGLDLFDSEAKYDSGTGWPSFSQPITPERVETAPDTAHGMMRTEAVCPRCGAHLGHVFDDGPEPTGQRYCMNSISLKFEKK